MRLGRWLGLALGVGLGLGLGLGLGEDAGAVATGYQPPAGWRELADLVIAPTSGGSAVTFRGAWGDPGAGCFLLGQVATIGPGGTPAGIYAAMTTALREAGFELRPTQAAAGATGTRLELAGGAFTALVAADAAVDDKAGVTTRVATCFFNQRQPETSRRLCERELKRFVAAR